MLSTEGFFLPLERKDLFKNKVDNEVSMVTRFNF